jgi:poly(A) polymerase
MVEIKQKPHLHASWIDPNAKEIVRVLQKEGFKTYLVGGCVRDLLAGIHPKDFDIATNAEPNQVKRKVWGSYVIGRRFRLVLVKRGDQQYEVATFRREMTADDIAPEDSEPQPDEKEDTKSPPSGDNFFGTPEQDAIRRDFTINGLFYDPIKDELIDYCNGMVDIRSRTLRMIGHPETRIVEDPVRSLRAIRLSHKLRFAIEPSLRKAIETHAADVARAVLPRRREEYLKFLRLPEPVPAFLELYDLGILHHILPSLIPVFDDPERREIFLHYIHDISIFCKDSSQPGEVFTPLIMGFIRATENHPDQDHLLKNLMKDELMLFKSEQAFIFGAIDLIESLKDVEGFKRRGHRRQTAFLRHECLMLALRIADVERLLTGEQLLFWHLLLSKN